MVVEFLVGLVVLVVVSSILLGLSYLYEKYKEIVTAIFLILLGGLAFVIICLLLGQMTIELWKLY